MTIGRARDDGDESSPLLCGAFNLSNTLGDGMVVNGTHFHRLERQHRQARLRVTTTFIIGAGPHA